MPRRNSLAVFTASALTGLGNSIPVSGSGILHRIPWITYDESGIRNQVTGFMDTGSMNHVTRLFRGGGLGYLRLRCENTAAAPEAWKIQV